MIPRFNDFPQETVTLNVISPENVYRFHEDLVWRIDYAERSHHREIQVDAFEPNKQRKLIPLIWNLDDALPDLPSILSPVDKDFSPYISESGPELLEDLEGARRNPCQYLLLIILGLDGTDKLDPWIISEFDRVFEEPVNLVHIYTTTDRLRGVRDLKRYKHDKDRAVSLINSGEWTPAQSVMEQMDLFLYFLDRMGWSYKTNTHPQQSGREMFTIPEPRAEDPMDSVDVKQTAVFKNQGYFTDVGETEAVFESI